MISLNHSEPQHTVTAVVIEVLKGGGLANLQTDDGRIIGLHRGTPGVDAFDSLQGGEHWRCTLTNAYERVVHAQHLASQTRNP